MSQFDGANESNRVALLCRAYEDVERKAGRSTANPSVLEITKGDAREYEFGRSLAEDYFEGHACDLKSFRGREKLRSDVFTKHLDLRHSIQWLMTLHDQMTAQLDRETNK